MGFVACVLNLLNLNIEILTLQAINAQLLNGAKGQISAVWTESCNTQRFRVQRRQMNGPIRGECGAVLMLFFVVDHFRHFPKVNLALALQREDALFP